ncbi:hypothetical protein BBJ28_00011677 [Nothophytophthora sp. Chile5]|nr:hypothetical protein BBJ28_00011677 [Nothophytophthora sp. Chile5]
MLVCPGRAAQRRALVDVADCSSSSEEDEPLLHSRADQRGPRVTRTRNCTNAKKAQRAALRRKAVQDRADKRRRRLAEWDRRLAVANATRMAARHNAEVRSMKLVATYHRLLARGYRVTDPSFPNCLEIGAFMHSSISEDIITPDFTGMETFLQQWDFLSSYHADMNMEMDRLELFPMEGAARTYPSLVVQSRGEAVYVVKSTGTTTLRISRATIKHIFPRILDDEQLVQWLIGKTYSFAFTVFYHISADGCIFQIESRVDLTSSIMTLLQNPVTTLQMLDEAAMSSSGNLLVQDEVAEAQNTLANCYL